MSEKRINPKVQSALNSVIELFTSGNLPEAVALSFIQAKRSEAPSSKWSLGNRLLMLMADTADARGYKQWQAIGRQVKKGSKAFYILAPLQRKIVEEDRHGNEQEKVITYGFKTIPVFRLEDTEGEPIEYPDYAPNALPPLWDVAKSWGLTVKYEPFLQRYLGYYHPGKQTIVLCTEDASTFFHELAHAAHGRVETVKGGQHQDQEIIAETVAAVLCKLYGLDGYIWHGARYIQAYAGGKNPGQAAMRFLATIEKVLEEIVNAVEGAGINIVA